MYRNPLLAAALVLSTCCSAARGNDIDPASGPVWTPGGHYTAELDLRAARLRLLPLDGNDQELSLRHACAPGRELGAGVYILVTTAEGIRLQRTHPQGELLVLGSEDVALVSCDAHDAPRSALRLPETALQALQWGAVGAVRVQP